MLKAWLIQINSMVLKFHQVYFLLVCYHLPLEKDVTLQSNKFESPSPKKYFVPSLVSSSEENVKGLRIDKRTDGQLTRSEKLT